ncbi:MAG: AraC family transcriptional regulator [Candidatus Marinimicrobia bacterium]|nr:AraC family transcriptional regulator [Candidatus Neomarinimicrobiota bacterium]
MHLSKIDTVGYVASGQPRNGPHFLDLFQEGVCYRYELLSAHLWEQHVSRRSPRAEHVHDVYHLVYYLAGRGVLRLKGQTHPVGPGLLVCTAPNEPHCFTPPGGRVTYHALTFALRAQTSSLKCSFQALLSAYLGRAVRLADRSWPAPEMADGIRRRMETIGHGLRRAPADGCDHARNMIGLLALLGAQEEAQAPRSLVARACQELEARFADPALTLAALGLTLHAAPEHICRQFRREMGVTPMQYRQQLRIQAAESLLRYTHLPCKAIADRVGYRDPYVFAKAYRRHTGQPPTQARRTG